MLKRRLLALLATPLLAAGAIAILLAVRHQQEHEAAVAVPPVQPGPNEGHGMATVVSDDHAALQSRLDGLTLLLRRLDESSPPATVAELQLLTEELASTTALIRDAAPSSLPDELASRYFETTLDSLKLLDRIAVAEDANASLISARGIAEFGRDTVARYLVETQFELHRQPDELRLRSVKDA